MIRRAVVTAVVALTIVLIAPVAFAEPPAPPAPIIPPPVQPANVGDLKFEAIQYYDSGAYLTDLQLAAAPAVAWIIDQAPRVDRPAVVFDIDETALSNWEAIKANDFGRVIGGPCNELPQGPCGWQAWDLRAKSTVIPPTMEIFTAAEDRGAAIFFIIGRPESQRAATERNLSAVGYLDYAQLIMEPTGAHYVSAADFKAPQRARRSSSRVTRSSRMSAINRPTWTGASRSEPTCCPTPSTAFRSALALIIVPTTTHARVSLLFAFWASADVGRSHP